MAEWVQNRGKSKTKKPLFLRAPFEPERMEKILLMACDVVVGLLLSCELPIKGTYPLAVAWFAARLLWDKYPFGVLLGIAIRLVVAWQPITIVNGWQFGACAVLYAFKGLQPKLHVPAPWGMAIIAGFVALLPIPFIWSSQSDTIGCLAGVVVTVFMTPAFDRLCASVKQRAYLEIDDRLSCLLAMAAFVYGGARLGYGSIMLGGVFAVYFTLLVAWTAESGNAIATGLALGAALSLAGYSPYVMISLATIAMIGSLLRGSARIWSCLAALLANALVTLCLTQGNATLFPITNILIGAAFMVFTPDTIVKTVTESLAKETMTQTAPGGVAIQWMQTCANALLDMSQIVPRPNPDEGGQVERLATHLCEACNRRSLCWDEKYDETTLTMNDLIQLSSDDTIKPDEITRLARMNGCQRADYVPDALRQVMRDGARLSAFESAQAQASRLARSQLKGQSELLTALSGMMAGASAATPAERMTITRALAKTRWKSCTAMPYRMDGLLQIVLIPPATGADVGDAPLGALQRALQMDMSSESLWDGMVYISQDPPLYVETGAATKPIDGQLDNGDGYRSLRLPCGRHLIALSDGMGHGTDAAEESRTVLTLLEKGFKAGYGRHELLSVVNDLMRSCHGAERYATVDLCLLDLKSGEAAFEKMGACASFLIRAESYKGRADSQVKCRKLAGGTLPMGILEDVSPKSFRMRLAPSDLVVMVSDGIVDAFGMEDDMLSVMATLPQEPQLFADNLLREALTRGGGKAQDDMTVVAARLRRTAYAA